MNYRRLLKSFAFAVVFLFLLGFAYPTITAEITQIAIPFQSQGSPVEINGTIYGSYLLSDAFNASYFFHPRPSGGNISVIGSNQTLNETERYISQFKAENPGVNISQIPYAMVAYSASGQDPNIPILGAYDQVARIAGAINSIALNKSVNVTITGLESVLNQKINDYEQRNFPIFGTYYVNTVSLNVWILNYMVSSNMLQPSAL